MASKLGVMFYLLSVTLLATPLFAQIVTSELCAIIAEVRLVIGLLALTLFVLGGVLYAVAHFLPSTLDIKKSMVAWATTMITGGVLGLILVIIGSPLIRLFISVGGIGLNPSTASPVVTVAC